MVAPPPPHVLVLPFPAQGHVIPLMELSHSLVDRGISVTLLVTESIHRRITTAAAAGNDGEETSRLRVIPFPDNLGPADPVRLVESLRRTIPPFLEDLVALSRDTHKPTWMIAHTGMAWSLPVAVRLGLRAAAFASSSAASVALLRAIPALLLTNTIDANGEPTNPSEAITLSPGMPTMAASELMWNRLGGTATQRLAFHGLLHDREALALAELVLCNTSGEAEPPALRLVPEILPIGPLLSGRRLGRAVGSFWREDADCIAWLDDQPANSVVYLAFGSCAVFERRQVEELAAGLELTGLRFLWVVRPGFVDDGAAAAAAAAVAAEDRGRIVQWAPQQRVLGHAATACFVTHCGWNSTMEGLASGVPLLCWPYFADQFLNQGYICDVWGVGWRLGGGSGGGGEGTVGRERIAERVEGLVGDEGVRVRAREWKAVVGGSVEAGGSSSENLDKLARAMKGQGSQCGGE